MSLNNNNNNNNKAEWIKKHRNKVVYTRRRPSGEHTPRRVQGNTLKDSELENLWP